MAYPSEADQRLMWDCERDLREMVQDIEPSPSYKSAASRSHNYLREVLDTGQFSSRIVDSYLSGSYARDTALHPIDDVDIVVVVDPAGWPSGFFGGYPPPDKILQSFATAIRYRYNQSSVYVQRRSVRLSLYHLDIDVVPAIQITGGRHRVEIPDGDSGEWIVSAPKAHTEIATEINQAQGKRFKPLVKLLKYWNSQLPDSARLKSFAIETLAATLFRHVNCRSLQEGLRCFFDFVASRRDQEILYSWPQGYGIQMNWWAQELHDIAGTGSNLLARFDGDHCKRFIQHAVRSRDALVLAENARTQESAARHIAKALKLS